MTLSRSFSVTYINQNQGDHFGWQLGQMLQQHYRCGSLPSKSSKPLKEFKIYVYTIILQRVSEYFLLQWIKFRVQTEATYNLSSRILREVMVSDLPNYTFILLLLLFRLNWGAKDLIFLELIFLPTQMECLGLSLVRLFTTNPKATAIYSQYFSTQ